MLELDFSGFYVEWGFWFFLVQGLAVALTALVPPLPAEVVVIGSGALAADGVFPLWGAFVATFVGSLVGDIGLYALFRYKLIRVLYRWRWGRGLHEKILQIASHTGGVTTWFGLLLVFAMPFGRSASMATAGMVAMGWVRLVGLAAAGGFLWCWWLIGLGYLPAVATEMPTWASTVAGLAVGTAAGGLIAFIGTKGRRVRL